MKHSALKAIAGILTTGGGTLFVGVDDDGNIVGIDSDLLLLDEREQDVDTLINNIKTDISTRFYEGDSVNDYVEIRPVPVQERMILKINITSRRRMSYLREPGQEYCPYRRQENRTTKVSYTAFEEFLAWRREQNLTRK